MQTPEAPMTDRSRGLSLRERTRNWMEELTREPSLKPTMEIAKAALPRWFQPRVSRLPEQ
jgi:hypothetical protein